MALTPAGKLELTWTNKHLRLLSDDEGGYTWLPPSDYRVAEVRLLHDLEEVGETHGVRSRAKDNLLIRGDALSALTSLCQLPEFAREYVGKVKLAYLDPPFNTQQAFEHYDDALEHSVWLTMMRDRLLQIRMLLSPDGSVWVHCDDSEQAYLKVMMDEVFGRENFVATVIWERTELPQMTADYFSVKHDYILCFRRSEESAVNGFAAEQGAAAHYDKVDESGRRYFIRTLRQTGPGSARSDRPSMWYPMTAPDGSDIYPIRGDGSEGRWRWGRERYGCERNNIEWVKSKSGWQPYSRTYASEDATRPPDTVWSYREVQANRHGKLELRRLFPETPPFATVKPERLMHRVIHIGSNPGDVVLDCFAGSGTTAAVAHKMGRRWVTVEMSADSVETFTRPRLEKVVAGDDPGGVTEQTGWQGGGGFRLLEVAASMFADVGGRVWLAEWAVDRELAEATAAQLGFDFDPEPPFAGRKGRTRLAVVDGLVSPDVVELLVGALGPDEKLVLCGTAVDPDATERLRELSRGSRTRKIPASILAEYRLAREWRAAEAPAPEREPVA
jgi:adenine-specific DNA-methyltransferase